MSSNQNEKSRPLVGIYAPELEGFYYGELVGQLLTLCRIKNYRVTVIKTGGYAEFTSKIHTDAMDMVILLRNAIHIELAKYLLDQGKSVVSISYDYFPLRIPFVTVDNEAGMQMGIEALKQEGHLKFSYIGNLKNFDIRKRYEAFCDEIEKLELQFSEVEVFQVEDDSISGGFDAADQYFRSKCDATAIVCGAAMNAIGFLRRLVKYDERLKEKLSLLAFDSIPLIPVLEPGILTVDQNLNLMAHKALVLAEKLEGDEETPHHKVTPKLISQSTEFMNSSDAYLATSFELSELYNANYIKSILCNLNEWSQSIADQKLENIMMLRLLFRRYLARASISRSIRGKSGKQYLVYTKLIGLIDHLNIDAKDAASVSTDNKFPADYQDFTPEEFDTCIHVPRFSNGKLWGFVSTYGITENNELPCSYTAFTTFLDQIVAYMTKEADDGTVRDSASDQESGEEKAEGKILWNQSSGEVCWDEEALAILGFTSELEQKIYQNMEIDDRLNAEHVNLLRNYLLNDQESDIPIRVVYKHKSREMFECELKVIGVDDRGNTVISIRQVKAGS